MDTSEKLRSLAIDRTGPSPPRRGPWPLIAVAALLAMAAMAAWIFFLKPPTDKPLAQGPASAANAPKAAGSGPASAAEAASQPKARGGLVASGYVVARRSATLSVDILGRLTSVQFDEGAVVEKGQLLAQLDDSLARYDLELNRARLVSARQNVEALKAQLIDARAERERSVKLSQGQAISQSGLQAAVATMDALVARLAQADADAKVAELSVTRQAEYVERHQLRAPFAGVIIAKNAQAGEILSPAAGGGEFTRTGIATLVDMASLEVEVDVNEGQIADVRPGQSATVVLDAYTDWEIPGEVIAIIPTANRDRATIKVRVGMKVRDPRILPQMAAKVTFDRSAK